MAEDELPARFGEDTSILDAANDADLELLLRQWGHYYGEPLRDRPRRVPATVMQRARAFAPGKADKRQAKGRSGMARALLMGAAAGLRTANGKVIPLSFEFFDPVPSPKEHNSPGNSSTSVLNKPGRGAPPEAQRVNREVNELEAVDLLRGLCLRAQYCIEGDRSTRARWVTDEFRKASHYAKAITEIKFKNEVQFAKVWMQARLTDLRRSA